ncbi:MAG: hypothetical protein LBE21_10055 [Pseudomonadales bacterium]|jgi:hypothetical protein|nr:hypothetical protein [Pseudomonadales bacterium]
MSNLGEQLRQIAERQKLKLETVVRRTVFQMATQMVNMSPVGNPTLWLSLHPYTPVEIGKDGKFKPAGDTETRLKPPAGYVGGRFRNNWQYGEGSINRDTSAPPDASGSGSLGRIEAGIASWKPGETMYITNSLEYAYSLEVGHSSQAPVGMVAVTMANFQAHFQRALADARAL